MLCNNKFKLQMTYILSSIEVKFYQTSKHKIKHAILAHNVQAVRPTALHTDAYNVRAQRRLVSIMRAGWERQQATQRQGIIDRCVLTTHPLAHPSSA